MIIIPNKIDNKNLKIKIFIGNLIISRRKKSRNCPNLVRKCGIKFYIIDTMEGDLLICNAKHRKNLLWSVQCMNSSECVVFLRKLFKKTCF